MDGTAERCRVIEFGTENHVVGVWMGVEMHQTHWIFRIDGAAQHGKGDQVIAAGRQGPGASLGHLAAVLRHQFDTGYVIEAVDRRIADIGNTAGFERRLSGRLVCAAHIERHLAHLPGAMARAVAGNGATIIGQTEEGDVEAVGSLLARGTQQGVWIGEGRPIGRHFQRFLGHDTSCCCLTMIGSCVSRPCCRS